MLGRPAAPRAWNDSSKLSQAVGNKLDCWFERQQVLQTEVVYTSRGSSACTIRCGNRFASCTTAATTRRYGRPAHGLFQRRNIARSFE